MQENKSFTIDASLVITNNVLPKVLHKLHITPNLYNNLLKLQYEEIVIN